MSEYERALRRLRRAYFDTLRAAAAEDIDADRVVADTEAIPRQILDDAVELVEALRKFRERGENR